MCQTASIPACHHNFFSNSYPTHIMYLKPVSGSPFTACSVVRMSLCLVICLRSFVCMVSPAPPPPALPPSSPRPQCKPPVCTVLRFAQSGTSACNSLLYYMLGCAGFTSLWYQSSTQKTEGHDGQVTVVPHHDSHLSWTFQPVYDHVLCILTLIQT